MKSKSGALAGLLVVAGVGGLAAQLAMLADGTVTPFTATASGTWATIVFALQAFLFGLFGFAWFMYDRRERGFPRSMGFNLALILFFIVAGPVYLWRSRAPGRRVPAILGMFGILVACWLVTVAATCMGLLIVSIILGLQRY